MLKPKTNLMVTIAAMLMLGVTIGCKPAADQSVAEPGTEPGATPEATAEGAIPDELVEFQETIQELPEDQWAVVYKQKICPVMKGPLGAMGTPIPVEVEGRTVYVCCAGCIDKLKAEPVKYLANIPE